MPPPPPASAEILALLGLVARGQATMDDLRRLTDAKMREYGMFERQPIMLGEVHGPAFPDHPPVLSSVREYRAWQRQYIACYANSVGTSDLAQHLGLSYRYASQLVRQARRGREADA